MAISGIGGNVSPLLQSVLTIDKQLQDLQRQLGTGQKSDTYSGLGSQSSVAVGLGAQLDATASYDNTISIVGTTIDLAQTVLSQVAKSGSALKSSAAQAPFDPDNSGVTTVQRTAQGALDTVLAELNTQGTNGYLFSGSGLNQQSVDTSSHILNGNGSQAGLIQVIAERRQADLGSGLGRLVISAPTPTSVAVSEDVAGSPFGFKLAGVSSSLTGATVTGPAGSPSSISVDLGPGNPNAGDSLTYKFSLPDGSSETLTLQATNSTTPGPGQFTIGATSVVTAANLNAAITTGVGQLAQTSLSAASAMAAGNDFFGNPPQRVAGPPFATATAQVAGTAANTVFWYTGQNGPQPARSTAVARIDPSIVVSYGLRANEQGVRAIVQNAAVLAATSYAASNPNAPASYIALNQRADIALAVPPGVQSIQNIEEDLASAKAAMSDATGRHRQTNLTLTNMLQQIEGVSNDQVAAQLLSLQTTLSASLSTTARLAQTSLLNYLAPVAG
ncbi:MAG TPA: flagellar biosynthesis protein FlgL [Xanthobacteraceae bacterium]